ncbi:hypothetical protein ACLM45_08200 [Synechococcus sp. A10-1-5-9]|uniref:hypothetical protein n=1 Tax=Synechococcus sp. A10-1-5-9 TaxID=3392295 RepID=UPI0039EA5F27
MNYVLTAAGNGTRFLKSGIKPPKPLILVQGEELLLKSLRSFPLKSGDNVFFVTQKCHNIRSILSKKLSNIYPNVSMHWLELDYIPNGQLLSAAEAIRHFNINDEFIVHNCDTSFDFIFDYLKDLLSSNPDCYSIVPVFNAPGDHWSFVKTSKKDSPIAIELSEKKRISSNCSIGTYYFSASSNFLCDVKDYVSYVEDKQRPGELYIAPFINYMLHNKHKKVLIMPALNHKIYGTPKELCESCGISHFELLSQNSWRAHQRKTLVVDVDGTLCGPPIKGDYNLCEPDREVIEKLRDHDKKGNYIILFTARNMRSFNGNIGLINKYTSPILLRWLDKYNVPYDEIVFGKPWGSGGVEYIDDKNTSVKDFVG